eukprot:COSAG02_NODE_207_length_29119_cov_41.071365_15_plen_74_part_00
MQSVEIVSARRFLARVEARRPTVVVDVTVGGSRVWSCALGKPQPRGPNNSRGKLAAKRETARKRDTESQGLAR